MMSKATEDAERTIENARKRLKDGTWPQVMAVFFYPNPKAPRVQDEEFLRLQSFYENASLPNMALFIEIVQFMEKECGVTMSFNFSLCNRRNQGDLGDSEMTSGHATLYFGTRDLLVGTRGGVEGAMVWFRNISEGISMIAPELLQILDKIFGEAVGIVRRPEKDKSRVH